MTTRNSQTKRADIHKKMATACRFCACNHHAPLAHTNTLAASSSSPQRSVGTCTSPQYQVARCTQTADGDTRAAIVPAAATSIYGRNGDRLGRQFSGGGGTTTEAVVFPRGDAFVAKEGRQRSPAPGTEPRGYVPSNILRNTSHRRFVQSLRAPGSCECTAHAGYGGGMRYDFPGPRVPDDLRLREADLRLSATIRRKNGPATRGAAQRQRIAAYDPAGPIGRHKQRAPAAGIVFEGRRRYDPPSSGAAARVVADTPVAPAPRDLMAASELGLRRDERYPDDIPPAPFRNGRVGSPLGFCPAVDARRSGGGGGGGGGGAAVRGSSTRTGNVAALSPSTTKPTRVAYEFGAPGYGSGSGSEAVDVYSAEAPSGDEVAFSPTNDLSLRRVYALDGRQRGGAAPAATAVRSGSAGPRGGRSGYAAAPAANASFHGRGGAAAARPASAGPVAASSRRVPASIAARREPQPANAADVAAWRRKYYPDGVHSVRRHFYEDAQGQAPPVCDRCCCRCCCAPGCEHARHKPGACPECLWWYS